MALYVNGVEVAEVHLNNVDLEIVYLDGVKVFQKRTWSDWVWRSTALTKNNTSNSTAPSVTTADINGAESNGYTNTPTKEVRNLSYRDPVYFSNPTTWWESQPQQYMNRNFTSTMGSVALRNYLNAFDSTTVNYIYLDHTYQGSSPNYSWSSPKWTTWESGYVHATYQAALNHASSHAGAIDADPNIRGTNYSTNGISNGQAYKAVLSYYDSRRTQTGTTYTYRIKYYRKIKKTGTDTGYTWTLKYEERTLQ